VLDKRLDDEGPGDDRVSKRREDRDREVFL
jgi:hypothetical protein